MKWIVEYRDQTNPHDGKQMLNRPSFYDADGEFEAVEGEAYSFSVEGKVETSTAILFVNGIKTTVPPFIEVGDEIKNYDFNTKEDEHESMKMQLTRVIDYLDYLPITTITIENI